MTANFDSLRVRDIYVPLEDYPHISASASVGDVIAVVHDKLAKGRHFRTILVHDDDNHLQGFLSIRDLIRAIGPHYLRKQQPSYKGHQPFQGMLQDFPALALIWQDGFSVKIKEAAKKPIADAMTLFEDTVRLEDPFAKCAYLMVIKDMLILPVVEETKVIGVVRLVDVFERIAENLCTEPS